MGSTGRTDAKATLVAGLSPHERLAWRDAAQRRREDQRYVTDLRQWLGRYRWQLFGRVRITSGSEVTLRRLVIALLEGMGTGIYAATVYQRTSGGFLHAHLLIGHRGWRGVIDGVHLRLHRQRWAASWKRLCRQWQLDGDLWLDRYRPWRTDDAQHHRGVSYVTRDVSPGEEGDEWELVGNPLRLRQRHRRKEISERA